MIIFYDETNLILETPDHAIMQTPYQRIEYFKDYINTLPSYLGSISRLCQFFESHVRLYTIVKDVFCTVQCFTDLNFTRVCAPICTIIRISISYTIHYDFIAIKITCDRDKPRRTSI